MNPALQVPFLLLFGLLVGTFGTMLGVGGGFLHVPVLMLLFDFEPQEAIATSITIIFINTFGGSVIYYFQRRMDFELAKKLSVAVIPGALLGPFIVERYTNDFFMTLFSGALLLASLFLVFGKSGISILPESQYAETTTIHDAFGETISYKTNVELGKVGTFIIGFLSNLVGVGGGIIHVPFMILFLRVPMHIAIGTSHFVLCVSSGVGMIVFLFLGHVNIDFAIPTGIGAILGATIGAQLARRTETKVLRKLLGVVLGAVAMRMIAKVW